jgi:hypothetical protein
MTKMIYVFHVICCRETGQANWLMRPAECALAYDMRCRIRVLTSADGEVGECHALGTHLKGQDLDGIQCLQRCEAEGVNEAKDVDHGKSCSTARLGCVWRWNAVIIATAIGGEGSGGRGNSNPNTSTAEVGEQEEWATTKSVDTSRTHQGNSERRASDAESNVQLCGCVLNTSGTEHSTLEVGDDRFEMVSYFECTDGNELQIRTIASKLTEDGDDTVAHQTVSSRSVLKQSTVIPPSLVGTIKFQNFIVLLELHLDPDAVRVAFPVILSKHSLGLVQLVVDE